MANGKQPRATLALVFQELQNVSAMVGELKDVLEGTPSTPGMKIRVDRLEQEAILKRRHLGYLWTAVVALAGLAMKLLFHS